MAELTVKLAEVPLKRTEVAPVNSVPVITTVNPTGPLVGLKLVMVGAARATCLPERVWATKNPFKEKKNVKKKRSKSLRGEDTGATCQLGTKSILNQGNRTQCDHLPSCLTLPKLRSAT